jgi:hypothetical protein
MISSLDFIRKLRWLDGSPLIRHVEPYRQRLFTQALDTFEKLPSGLVRPRYNLVLAGRAKKNAKTLDLILASLHCLLTGDTVTHDSENYLLANDQNQAADDLTLAKKLIIANPALAGWLRIKRNVIERRDSRGFIEILPAQDAVGQHGKTYRLCGFDEIHGFRDWSLFEALQPDPTRVDSQMWVTSYASLHHRPGVPLFDLCQRGRAGSDPRLLFSWYAGDFTTDPDFANVTPEDRANPSRGSWADTGYLEQQKGRLPAHKYRRLHLNLPGLPEGSMFQPEPVMDAVERGVLRRPYDRRQRYVAFVDMSGGTSDDAVLAIAHKDAEGRALLDAIVNQGPRPPFDPRLAVQRFVSALKEYGVSRVTGDKYAGETFVADFERHRVAYHVSDKTKSQLYEAFEPLLNGNRVVLLDVAAVEQQLLGLGWRGGKIDHANGEHDDWSNAAVGVLVLVTDEAETEISLPPPIIVGGYDPEQPWLGGGYSSDPGYFPPSFSRWSK